MPLVAFCAVLLMVMLALAIDIGMIAIARSQCQNAADAAAMSGARTFNGNPSITYNLTKVPQEAVTAAVANNVLGIPVVGDPTSITTVNSYTYESGNVEIQVGAYEYKYDDTNPSSEGFEIQFPKESSSEPYTAVRATVQGTGSYAFARVLGLTAFNTQATAVSVHRPRDVVIIMDLSGSMRFQSLPGSYVHTDNVAYPSSLSLPRTHSLNPESVYPEFGHYSSNSANLQGTKSYSTGDEWIDPANISTTSNSGPPIAEDFYANAYGVAPSSANRAFARSSDNYATTPGGDDYLRTNNNSGSSIAQTVNDIVSSSIDVVRWENYGYQAYRTNFHGYTEGPGYWGKTFFIWPPDPRGSNLNANDSANHVDNGAKDWRQRFFIKRRSDGNLGWLDHNEILFEESGSPATQSNWTPSDPVLQYPTNNGSVVENGSNVTYQWRPNYAAILKWLDTAPKHFPSQLRAGRIVYYSAFPNYNDSSLNSRWWSTTNLTDKNEQFWREYIDFVLGIQHVGNNDWSRKNIDPDDNSLSQVPLSAMIGSGDYFQWGSHQITDKPWVQPGSGNYPEDARINHSGGYDPGDGTGSSWLYVDGIPSSPDPAVGYYVKFENHDTLYTITARGFNGGTVNRIQIDDGSGTGLKHSVSDNQDFVIYHSNLGGEVPIYMDYNDNPYRPRHQLWFGPMTFIDFLGNYNTTRFWWPGNVHEAQNWACKVGIQTAIDDIKNNHPSDFIGMAFFSSPKYSGSGDGQHNSAVVPLGRNYDQLKDSLWFPPTTITGGVTEITPYDDDFDNVPRAKGGTAPQMGFMIAYNLFSSSVDNLRLYAQPNSKYRGVSGGLGRKGAARLIIFETDGAPNTRAHVSINNKGSDSYYPIRIKYPSNMTKSGNEFPSGGSYSSNEVYSVVKQICALTTAGTPGFSTKRKPVEVFALGYGTLFDPANSSSTQNSALNYLQTIQYYGNTASTTSGSSFPPNQLIYGTTQERIDRMQQAFTTIMQSGIQVSLIE